MLSFAKLRDWWTSNLRDGKSRFLFWLFQFQAACLIKAKYVDISVEFEISTRVENTAFGIICT